jgi:phospholipid/cholesterol/gamma-HCH transport system substrate-binding protein
MKRRNEVLVGLFLTIGIAVLLVGTIWLARGQLASGYKLYASFPWGAGLKQGQPVLLAGVTVGFVDQVELKREGTILVTMRIRKGFQVPEGTSAAVEPNGLFGDMLVALRPSRFTKASIAPGDTVPLGRPQPTMTDIMAKADSVASSTVELVRHLQVEMVEQGGLADLRRAIASTNKLVETLGRIAAEQSMNANATFAAVQRTVKAVDSSRVDSTVQHLERTSENVEALSADLRVTANRLNAVLAKLDSTNGTAGRLLNDTLMYHDVRALVAHLDSLTVDFKAHPRKYVKLSIF